MRTQLRTAALWLSLALLPTTGFGAIIHVDGDAPEPSNGTSWANAFTSLQDAIAQATQGDEIRVAQGVYTPDRGAGQKAGDRKATFQLKSGVKILGGYAGFGQPSPDSRNVEAYLTVLSGDLRGNDGPIDPSPSTAIRDLLADPSRQDNSYVVVMGSDVDATAALSGFTITGGVSGMSWPMFYGGEGAGLFVFKGSPAIQDCTFQDNLATDGGAGVACREASPAFTTCTFKTNRSLSGGGAMSSWNSSVVISQCVFSSNRSDDNWQTATMMHWSGSGGAIYSYDSRLTIRGTTFDHNGKCFDGGALFNSHASDANVVDCQFVANTSSYKGGAIENSDGSTLTLTRCLFLRNSASFQGAAVQTTDANSTVTQCRFIGNTAGLAGGALYNTQSVMTAVDSLFTGNTTADIGGAIANEASRATVTNCTFVANKAPTGGASIACTSINPPETQSMVKVFNSILWNQAEEIFCPDGSGYVVTFSDVFDVLGSGVWTVWANEDNLSVDPGFVDPLGPDGVAGTEDDNLRLAAGSPCIDSGDNGRVPEGVVTDLDGNGRFVDDPATPDTGDGQPPIVDRGAYEFVVPMP